MSDEIIKIAQVVSIKDPSKSGAISCVWPGETSFDNVFSVTYTTPFYSPPIGNENSDFAGMYAVPTEGSNILIARAWNGMDWVYIASIPTNPLIITSSSRYMHTPFLKLMLVCANIYQHQKY